jgi:acyl-homoserine lactone acylase PvdQ
LNGFMFDNGPSERFVSEARPDGIYSVSSLPGGTSGVLGSPYYVNLLPQWLVNHAYTQLFDDEELERNTASEMIFIPRRK